MTFNTAWGLIEKSNSEETSKKLNDESKIQLEKNEEDFKKKTKVFNKKWEPWLKFCSDIFNIAFWFNIIGYFYGLVCHADFWGWGVPVAVLAVMIIAGIVVPIVNYVLHDKICDKYLKNYFDMVKVHRLTYINRMRMIEREQAMNVINIAKERALTKKELELLEDFYAKL